jgi:hypothetical protein
MGSTCSTPSAERDTNGAEVNHTPHAMPSSSVTLDTSTVHLAPSPATSDRPRSQRNPLRPLASSFATIADLEVPPTPHSYFPSTRSTPRSRRTCTIEEPSSNSSRGKRNESAISPSLRTGNGKHVTLPAMKCGDLFDFTISFPVPMPWHSS